jgi:hypothetical protein
MQNNPASQVGKCKRIRIRRNIFIPVNPPSLPSSSISNVFPNSMQEKCQQTCIPNPLQNQAPISKLIQRMRFLPSQLQPHFSLKPPPLPSCSPISLSSVISLFRSSLFQDCTLLNVGFHVSVGLGRISPLEFRRPSGEYILFSFSLEFELGSEEFEGEVGSVEVWFRIDGEEEV